jgi:hypothetical protein
MGLEPISHRANKPKWQIAAILVGRYAIRDVENMGIKSILEIK